MSDTPRTDAYVEFWLKARFAWCGDEQTCSKMLKILNEARPTNPIPKQ